GGADVDQRAHALDSDAPRRRRRRLRRRGGRPDVQRLRRPPRSRRQQLRLRWRGPPLPRRGRQRHHRAHLVDGPPGPRRGVGTSVEASGVVTLRDPGTPIPLPGFNQVVSNIENEETLANGAGDFTVSAYWMPVVPATDTEFHLQTYAVQGLIEAAGLTFTNL